MYTYYITHHVAIISINIDGWFLIPRGAWIILYDSNGCFETYRIDRRLFFCLYILPSRFVQYLSWRMKTESSVKCWLNDRQKHAKRKNWHQNSRPNWRHSKQIVDRAARCRREKKKSESIASKDTKITVRRRKKEVLLHASALREQTR